MNPMTIPVPTVPESGAQIMPQDTGDLGGSILSMLQKAFAPRIRNTSQKNFEVCALEQHLTDAALRLLIFQKLRRIRGFMIL